MFKEFLPTPLKFGRWTGSVTQNKMFQAQSGEDGHIGGPAARSG
jgi:hypothetical protein